MFRRLTFFARRRGFSQCEKRHLSLRNRGHELAVHGEQGAVQVKGVGPEGLKAGEFIRGEKGTAIGDSVCIDLVDQIEALIGLGFRGEVGKVEHGDDLIVRWEIGVLQGRRSGCLQDLLQLILFVLVRGLVAGEGFDKLAGGQAAEQVLGVILVLRERVVTEQRLDLALKGGVGGGENLGDFPLRFAVVQEPG